MVPRCTWIIASGISILDGHTDEHLWHFRAKKTCSFQVRADRAEPRSLDRQPSWPWEGPGPLGRPDRTCPDTCAAFNAWIRPERVHHSTSSKIWPSFHAFSIAMPSPPPQAKEAPARHAPVANMFSTTGPFLVEVRFFVSVRYPTESAARRDLEHGLSTVRRFLHLQSKWISRVRCDGPLTTAEHMLPRGQDDQGKGDLSLPIPRRIFAFVATPFPRSQ